MRCLGIDVHVSTTVWCLLDERGEIVRQGKSPTTVEGLRRMLEEVGGAADLRVGQEVGKLSYFVFDTLTSSGVELVSFNAYHLRMIAASRKKTDRRDAYWIAKALQTGMTPHPVYIPTGLVRELRRLMSRRSALVKERRRWLLRARSYLHAAGIKPRIHRTVTKLIDSVLEQPLGIDADLYEALSLCKRMDENLLEELATVETMLYGKASANDDIRRLITIPSFGIKVATAVYAAVGDIKRFPDARSLASYAGLVPSVSQSGSTAQLGRITKEGPAQLRAILTQAAHVLLWRCQNDEAQPLKSIVAKIHQRRLRRKIAVVAAARHLLRLAFYVLRDGTELDPTRLSAKEEAEVTSAA